MIEPNLKHPLAELDGVRREQQMVATFAQVLTQIAQQIATQPAAQHAAVQRPHRS
jgi:hypothetical protein